jgi:hypothetical protein
MVPLRWRTHKTGRTTIGRRLDKFQYWFVEAIRLPKPEADFESKVLAVEFYTTLPWVIAEQPILFQALASFAALQR